MNNSQWQGNTNWLLAQTYEAHDFPYTHKNKTKNPKSPTKNFFLISLFLRYKYIYTDNYINRICYPYELNN